MEHVSVYFVFTVHVVDDNGALASIVVANRASGISQIAQECAFNNIILSVTLHVCFPSLLQ